VPVRAKIATSAAAAAYLKRWASINRVMGVAVGLSLFVALFFLLVLALAVSGFVWLVVYLSRRRDATSPDVPITPNGSKSEST